MNKKLRRKVKKTEPMETQKVQETKGKTNTGTEEEIKDQKAKKEHHILRTVIAAVSVIVCTIGVFIALTSHWAFETWPNLGVEEMLFQLTNNVAGTGGGILESFAYKCIVPSLIICAGLIVMIVLVRRRPEVLRNTALVGLCFGLALSIISVHTFYVKADVKGYLEAQSSDSNFIEDNYADPASTKITFPETKRNLIYIFLESMEMTYADKADGGGFDYNCIPELTELAEENECFAGNTGILNGAHAYQNAHYTSAAMFAQTSGLPLQLNEDIYSLNNHDVFYPGISSIGTILESQGYSNTLLIGSDGDFGNRASYFENHGSYEIRDYKYAIEKGWIPSGYRVLWGYEDKKLFANAQTTLDELSSKDQPFNLTMLTADTHFEDGYVCEDCPDTYDTQYANVMACSSKRVREFIDWCRTQPWYDNTTIVINGDHKTMDSDFCDDVDASYDRRTYTCYINAAAQPADPDKERVYSTQDNFPTTLAAMGCQIEGERLGLGTNLFSDQETLSEKYGIDRVDQEMRNKSQWLVDQSNVSSSYGGDVSFIEREDGGISVYAADFSNLTSSIDAVTVQSDSDSGSITREMIKLSDGDPSVLGDEVYATKLSAEECNEGNPFHIRIDLKFDDGSCGTVYEREYSHVLREEDAIGSYISQLKEKDCDVLLAYKPGHTVISQNVLSRLKELGFRKVPGGIDSSYVGALTENGVEENRKDSNGQKIDASGTLSCAHPYELISSGGENTDIARISVDGLNCSMNDTGLNIVAVDRDTGYILDSACFNPETRVLSHK